MKQESLNQMNPRWLWLMAGCVLLMLLAALMPPSKTEQTPAQAQPPKPANATHWREAMERWAAAQARRSQPSATAQEIVAAKLKKFSAKRRALVDALAKQNKIDVLPEVARFFDALDAGDWDETQRLFKSLREDMDGPDASDLRKYWRAVVEAYGAAQQVHLWPPQQLLDYGNGILDSLRPGMVYVGGTDPGCFICTMLNETSQGEQHVTLTQNALADASYLDYLSAVYGDSLNLPTPEESSSAFTQYVADATARAQHDEQFPGEPPQVLPGEEITTADGRTTVGGQVAVMGINNILMQTILQKNPDLSFAMEESFPLASSYAGAAPLGPVFELRAGDPLTADAAAQSVNYWQNEAQNLQDAGETSTPVLRSYSHDADSQGNLLANNNYPAEAGQAYQTALNIWPGSMEAITGLTRVLAQQGQFDQAGQALDTFLQNNPQESQIVSNLRQTWLAHH
jgi:tetratricopeptide (TPR) repeat protein